MYLACISEIFISNSCSLSEAVCSTYNNGKQLRENIFWLFSNENEKQRDYKMQWYSLLHHH